MEAFRPGEDPGKMPALLGASQATRFVLLVAVKFWAHPLPTTPMVLETASVLKADEEMNFSSSGAP